MDRSRFANGRGLLGRIDADWLAAEMVDLGYSCSRLAAVAGISRNTITKALCGDAAHLRTIRAIVTTLRLARDHERDVA